MCTYEDGMQDDGTRMTKNFNHVMSWRRYEQIVVPKILAFAFCSLMKIVFLVYRFVASVSLCLMCSSFIVRYQTRETLVLYALPSYSQQY
jgi:hypothetical protein